MAGVKRFREAATKAQKKGNERARESRAKVRKSGSKLERFVVSILDKIDPVQEEKIVEKILSNKKGQISKPPKPREDDPELKALAGRSRARTKKRQDAKKRRGEKRINKRLQIREDIKKGRF